MILLVMLASFAGLQTDWTWTLYEGEGPVVLANEIPDTPQLRSVIECAPGSGIARVDLYGSGNETGIATLASGTFTATVESGQAGDHRSVVLRTDHPVFGQFVANGLLDVAVAGQHQGIVVEAAHLAKLRRFAELCGG